MFPRLATMASFSSSRMIPYGRKSGQPGAVTAPIHNACDSSDIVCGGRTGQAYQQISQANLHETPSSPATCMSVVLAVSIRSGPCSLGEGFLTGLSLLL